LLGRLTAPEYLRFVGRMYGLDREIANQRTEELLEFMQLADERRKLITDFSHGMQKKLALAAAVIHGPKILFLDEPFVRTSNWVRNPNGELAPPATFEVTDELGNRPLGWVPHWPLGTHQTEFAEHTGIPFQATQGGKVTMYPEYMLEIERLKMEEAAKKKK